MGEMKRLIASVKQLIASDENQRRILAQQRLNRKEPGVLFNSWKLTRGFPGVILPWFHRLGRTLDLERLGRESGPMRPNSHRKSRSSSCSRKLTDSRIAQTTPRYLPS